MRQIRPSLFWSLQFLLVASQPALCLTSMPPELPAYLVELPSNHAAAGSGIHLPGTEIAGAALRCEGLGLGELESSLPKKTLDAAAAFHSSLIEAGTPGNLLITGLYPERAYYANGAVRERALARLKEVAAFAQENGFSGLVLDTASTALFQDFRWRGYTYEDYDEAALAESAQAFGHGLAERIWSAHPAASLILTADRVFEAGPLWFCLLEGITAGAERHGAPLTLFVRVPLRGCAAGALPVLLEREQTMLLSHFEPARSAYWQRRGRVEPALTAAAPDSPADGITFDLALLAARLCAWSRVWVMPGAELPLNGLTTPVDGMTRIGAWEFGGRPAHYLLDGGSSAVAALTGTAAPLPSENGARLTVTGLRGQDAVREEAGPFQGPVLIRGVPLRKAVAAGLQAVPIPAGDDALDVAYTWTNPAREPLDGVLAFVADEDAAVRPGQRAFSLGPGETLSGKVQVRSVGLCPGRVTLRFVFAFVSGPSASRVFRFHIPPSLAWSAHFNGPVTLRPRALAQGGLLVCSGAGEAACLGVSGAIRWRRPGIDAKAVSAPGRSWLGGGLIALGNAEDRVCALGDAGQLLWQSELPGAALCVWCADLHPLPGDEVLVLTEDSVEARLGNGAVAWRHQGASPKHAGTVVQGGSVRFVYAAGPALCALRADGTVAWESPRRAPEATPTALTALEDAKGPPGVVAAGDEAGGLALHAIATGALLARSAVPGGEPITALVAADLPAFRGGSLLVCGPASLLCCTRELEPLWSANVACSGAPVVAAVTGEPRILAPVDGGLTCLSQRGTVLWRDDRAVGPVTAPLPLEAPGGGMLCVYGAGDRIVRAFWLEKAADKE